MYLNTAQTFRFDVLCIRIIGRDQPAIYQLDQADQENLYFAVLMARHKECDECTNAQRVQNRQKIKSPEN